MVNQSKGLEIMTKTMWKPPARREYQPKPMDPGQRVAWSVTIPGRWERPGYMDGDVYRGPSGKWIEDVTYTREGTVWSVATSASCWWVVPDDAPGNAVVVRRAGKSQHSHREGELFQTREGEGWREGIRRAENVRRRGVYAVVDREDTSRSWAGPGTTWKTLTWHADPGCPQAAGKPRDDGTGCAHNRQGPGLGQWDVHSVVDVLTGRAQLSSPPPFCGVCIMLEDAAEAARELVPA
jgi:hypothetical protein